MISASDSLSASPINLGFCRSRRNRPTGTLVATSSLTGPPPLYAPSWAESTLDVESFGAETMAALLGDHSSPTRWTWPKVHWAFLRA